MVRFVMICIRSVDRKSRGACGRSVQTFCFGVFPMVHSIVSSVVRRFVRDERGATMVEYGLLVALVAVAVIGAVTALGGSINTFFQTADDGLNGV